MAVLGGLGSILGSVVGAALADDPAADADRVSRLRAYRARPDHDRVHDLPARRHRAEPRDPVPAESVMSVLAAENLGIQFGGVKAVDGVSFSVNQGEIFAIIGPNGAGKTTLFNLISGLYVPPRGKVMLNGQDVTNLPAHVLAQRGLSRTFQNLQIFFRMTAAENVMVGCHLHENRNVLAHLFRLPSVVCAEPQVAPARR